MSRIGKVPIEIPKGVKISVSGQKVTVEGPKGKLERVVNNGITVKADSGKIVVARADDMPQTKAFHGLNHRLISGMLAGVTQGFSKKLIIVGTGFRASVSGKVLEMLLGYSSPVKYDIPAGITIKVEKNVELEVSGIDKQLVGDTAARIRSFYPPEPYKGKGIRYDNEQVKRKAGKTVA